MKLGALLFVATFSVANCALRSLQKPFPSIQVELSHEANSVEADDVLSVAKEAEVFLSKTEATNNVMSSLLEEPIPDGLKLALSSLQEGLAKAENFVARALEDDKAMQVRKASSRRLTVDSAHHGSASSFHSKTKRQNPDPFKKFHSVPRFKRHLETHEALRKGDLSFVEALHKKTQRHSTGGSSGSARQRKLSEQNWQEGCDALFSCVKEWTLYDVIAFFFGSYVDDDGEFDDGVGAADAIDVFGKIAEIQTAVKAYQAPCTGAIDISINSKGDFDSYVYQLDGHNFVGFWRPKRKPGYFSLGDILTNYASRPKEGFLYVKDNGDLLAEPIDYKNRGFGGNLYFSGSDTRGGTIWEPVAPTGYSCLGYVAEAGRAKPSTGLIRCVKNDVLVKTSSKYIVGAGDYKYFQTEAKEGTLYSGFFSRSSEGHSLLNEELQCLGSESNALESETLYGPTETANVKTYDEAKAFCASHDQVLASNKDVCGDNRKVTFGIQDGDQWTPVSDLPNEWVSTGTRHTECVSHREHPWFEPPAWGTNNDKKSWEANYILCVRKRETLYGPTETANVKTYDEAKAFCASHGQMLASNKDVCGDNRKVTFGIKGGDQWTPVSDLPNEWVQTGTHHTECVSHREHPWFEPPAWGTNNDKKPWEANYILCVRNDILNEQICSNLLEVFHRNEDHKDFIEYQGPTWREVCRAEGSTKYIKFDEIKRVFGRDVADQVFEDMVTCAQESGDSVFLGSKSVPRIPTGVHEANTDFVDKHGKPIGRQLFQMESFNVFQSVEPNHKIFKNKQLRHVGNNPNHALGRCEGDCDEEGTGLHCKVGLVCQRRANFVGSSGCKGVDPRNDYCVIDPKMATYPSIDVLGDNPGETLGLCQGDCDEHNHCAANLVCQRRWSGRDKNGCLGSASGDDICILPKTDPDIAHVGDEGKPKEDFPLGLCQGNCRSTDDCARGLVCYERERRQVVPGCKGGEDESLGHNYCIAEPIKHVPNDAFWSKKHPACVENVNKHYTDMLLKTDGLIVSSGGQRTYPDLRIRCEAKGQSMHCDVFSGDVRLCHRNAFPTGTAGDGCPVTSAPYVTSKYPQTIEETYKVKSLFRAASNRDLASRLTLGEDTSVGLVCAHAKSTERKVSGFCCMDAPFEREGNLWGTEFFCEDGKEKCKVLAPTLGGFSENSCKVYSGTWCAYPRNCAPLQKCIEDEIAYANENNKKAYLDYVSSAPKITDTWDLDECGIVREYFGFAEDYPDDDEICEDVELLRFNRAFDNLDGVFSEPEGEITDGGPTKSLKEPEEPEISSTEYEEAELALYNWEVILTSFDEAYSLVQDFPCPDDWTGAVGNACKIVQIAALLIAMTHFYGYKRVHLSMQKSYDDMTLGDYDQYEMYHHVMVLFDNMETLNEGIDQIKQANAHNFEVLQNAVEEVSCDQSGRMLVTNSAEESKTCEAPKVQCGFDSSQSSNFKTLILNETESRKEVDTGLFYKMEDSCSAKVTIDVSVTSNEIDKAGSIFLATAVNQNGSEKPILLAAPTRCASKSENNTVCIHSGSPGRIYQVTVLATDSSGRKSNDTCWIIVPDESAGDVDESLRATTSEKEQRQILESNPTWYKLDSATMVWANKIE